MLPDVQRDQPEHSPPLETERAASSTARQEDFALTCRHDTAQRAHHAGLRRPVCLSAVTMRSLVHEWLDVEREGLDVRPGREWVRQLLHGMRLSYKKPAAVADGQAHWQRRPRREHRRDLLSPPACASDRVGPPRREANSAVGQHEGGHDIRGRLQHGPWRAGHAGADRELGPDRRRLAGAALAGAHSSRHVREQLGHDDHNPAARGHIGRRDEPKQRRTIVDPSLGHGQHPRHRSHHCRQEDRTVPSRRAVLHPAAQHILLAALRRGRLPQFQELHPGASERHSCPLRLRRLVRRRRHEQGMATAVFG